ncbi:DUF4118 domain-containing protein (plasmid) [Deinococcus taeanensis]|uniref:sensor histidine kinase n=1 Tax=Deinococcus taeanensis TaxID=2737050 RepID=UPI001CDD2BB1|nr:ATP-binding protein [Deinococcus taeanensis]UBV44287.1 DUF4118 domain-containing protein [Deinococcus taeanensis]
MVRPSLSARPDANAPRPVPGRSAPYALAVIASALALMVRLALNAALATTAPYTLSLLAVTAAAVNGGFRAGLLATVLSAAGVNVLITAPAWRLQPVPQAVSLVVFLVVGAAVSWLGSNRLEALRRIQAAHQALEEREAQLRALSDNLPGAMTYQAEGSPGGRTGVLYVSANVERLNGVTPAEVYAAPDTLFRRIDPRAAAHLLAAEASAVQTGQPFEVEVPFCLPDGARRWMRLASQRRTLPDGREVWDGVQIDVTEQRDTQEALRAVNAQLEERVRERTRQLERSNQELTQFASVASHDLKAPIRTVVNFLQLLERRAGAQLDDRAREYIRVTVDAAGRMNQLVDDLLTYSRVGQERTRGPVNAQEVLEGVLRDLSSTLQDRGAAVQAGPLPPLQTDPVQLHQVLLNLLGNAVKFQPPGRAPQVCVQARPEGGLVHVTVRDNGIGIAPEHQERIFEVFQRLHTQEQFAGSGLGLAISRKIVEEHGGQLWVESVPGEGSTFHFTMPGAEAGA